MRDYFHTLPSKEQVRYEEKLGLVGLKREDDPYLSRNDSNYTDSMSLWSNVEYGHIFCLFLSRDLVYTPCTKEQLLSWKQLESYNYFHNGYCNLLDYRLGKGCSHVAAVLFKVECAVRLGYTSSTSQLCAWNQDHCTQVISTLNLLLL